MTNPGRSALVAIAMWSAASIETPRCTRLCRACGASARVRHAVVWIGMSALEWQRIARRSRTWVRRITFRTSLIRSEGAKMADQPHSKRAVNSPFEASGRQLNRPLPLNFTILNRYHFSGHLGLRPRWYPIEQHFFERPDMIGKARRHRRRARLPHLGRTAAVGWDRLDQRLAQTHMGQDEIMVYLEQNQQM
jgi:hypothetical protein